MILLDGSIKFKRVFTILIPTLVSEAVQNPQTVSRVNMKTHHGTEEVNTHVERKSNTQTDKNQGE